MPNALDLDARTAWAHHTYRAAGHRHIPEAAVTALLAALGRHEHAEVIVPAAGGYLPGYVFNPRNPYEAGWEQTAIRTITRWLCCSPDGVTVSIPGPVTGEISMSASEADKERGRDWMSTTFDVGDERWQLTVLVGKDSALFKTIFDGAGPTIRRLPDQACVPPMPDLDVDSMVDIARPGRPDIPADWSTVEDLAAEHLRTLGFDDARRTGAGRDGGIDVAGTGVVAQVKMQALPVGAPVVRQLRGARPDAGTWIFYSTSGYSRPAVEDAESLDVALFTISRTGQILPSNDAARSLEESGRDGTPGPWSVARMFADEVSARVRQHVSDCHRFNPKALGDDSVDIWNRSAAYLDRALADIQHPPLMKTPRSMLVHYHHADLLAAVGARNLAAVAEGTIETEPSIEDFYA